MCSIHTLFARAKLQAFSPRRLGATQLTFSIKHLFPFEHCLLLRQHKSASPSPLTNKSPSLIHCSHWFPYHHFLDICYLYLPLPLPHPIVSRSSCFRPLPFDNPHSFPHSHRHTSHPLQCPCLLNSLLFLPRSPSNSLSSLSLDNTSFLPNRSKRATFAERRW